LSATGKEKTAAPILVLPILKTPGHPYAKPQKNILIN
jgi:hypothetical protein